jgi:hypothetical protein
VRVHLATAVESNTRPDSGHEVHLELLTTYERLGRFSRHLIRVLRGDLDVAVLGQEVMM